MQPEQIQEPKRRGRWKWIAVCFFVLGSGYFVSVAFRGLSDDEQKLVGTWTWEQPTTPGSPMVIHYGSDRVMRYDQPPFARPGFYRWSIKGNKLNHAMTGRGFMQRLGSLVAPNEVDKIEFVDGGVAFTLLNGKKRKLIPYKGNADKLKNAKL